MYENAQKLIKGTYPYLKTPLIQNLCTIHCTIQFSVIVLQQSSFGLSTQRT